MYKLGIIGSGNMAKAIVSGIIKAKLYLPDEIYMSDVSADKREKMRTLLGVSVTGDNSKLVKESEIIISAIKPQMFRQVFDKEFGILFEAKIFISIMAGIHLKQLEAVLPGSCAIARVMPNTPALVQSGMSSVCYNESAGAQDKKKVQEILSCMGEFIEIKEGLFGAATAVAGCSPAFVFMMMEAMADEAVALGLAREDAYYMAATAIRGSADLYLKEKEHPAALKDRVCSPAGATIEGVRVLEKEGFRFSLMEAMRACSDKSVELGKAEV